MSYFSQYARAKYSQNGEEGILFELFKRIGVEPPGTFVEFGVGPGVACSNTLLLAENGGHGVWIECDDVSFPKAKALGDTFEGRVETLHELIALEGEKSLDAILAKTKTPHDVDFMSIDIDSYDLHVWESLKNYKPKIVLFEINSSIPVGVEFSHKPGVDSGASFTTATRVGREKGYVVVAHTGNLFFVDEKYKDKLEMPEDELKYPEKIFNTSWVKAAGPDYVKWLLAQ